MSLISSKSRSFSSLPCFSPSSFYFSSCSMMVFKVWQAFSVSLLLKQCSPTKYKIQNQNAIQINKRNGLEVPCKYQEKLFFSVSKRFTRLADWYLLFYEPYSIGAYERPITMKLLIEPPVIISNILFRLIVLFMLGGSFQAAPFSQVPLSVLKLQVGL